MKNIFVLACFALLFTLVVGCDTQANPDPGYIYAQSFLTSQECGSIQQDANDTSKVDSDPKQDNCTGHLLRVPADCATIQQAVNVAKQQPMDAPPEFQRIIVLADGLYKENVIVPKRVNIVILGQGSFAIIDGGDGIAINVGEESRFVLHGVTVRNATKPDCCLPTIKTGWRTNVLLDSVIILTEMTGFSGSSSYPVVVTNSTFIGDSLTSFTKGIDLNQTQLLSGDTAPWIYGNTFRYLDWAIAICGGKTPQLGSNEPDDSNQYDTDKTLLMFNGNACE